MTKTEIHRKALLAAAKIALVTVGCSGAEGVSGTAGVTDSSDGATAAPRGDAPVASVPATSTASPPKTVWPLADAGAAAKGCELPVYSLPTDPDILCCEGEVEDAHAAATAGSAVDAGAPSKDLVACCAVVVDYYDKNASTAAMSGHTLSWSDRHSCCAILDPMPIGPTCTPWGPPPPPSMPAGWEWA